jgi:hypothetical protein
MTQVNTIHFSSARQKDAQSTLSEQANALACEQVNAFASWPRYLP